MSPPSRPANRNHDEDTDQLPVLPESAMAADDLEHTGTHIFRPPASLDPQTLQPDPLEQTTVFHPDQLAELRGEASEAQRLQKALAETRQALEEALEKLADREMAAARLEVELRDARQATATAQAELTARGIELAEIRSARQQAEDALAELRPRLSTQAARIDELATARQALQDRLSAREAEEGPGRSGGAAAQPGLAEALQDLRAYVDRRREAWTALNHELAARAERLTELEAELAQRERQQIATRRRLKTAEQAMAALRNPAPAASPPASAPPEPPTQHALVAILPDSRLRYPLPSTGAITIGRSSANDIQLRTQFVSRQHAVLRTDPDGCKLEDLGSRNGVLVNGQMVRRHQLRDGDELVFGESRFRYEERDDDERFGRTLG
ncbi:MAG: FHA domain-containing protein [Gammaproteobacteria bacterium]|nr:FHA domain-containing protein [Gammaproteobacteria bacterium]